MNPLEITLSILLFLGLLFLAWYFTRRAKFREKIILHEKGINQDGSKRSDFPKNEKTFFTPLRLGILIIGIALGLLLISYLGSFMNVSTPLGLAILFLFAGVFLVISNFVDKSKEKDING